MMQLIDKSDIRSRFHIWWLATPSRIWRSPRKEWILCWAQPQDLNLLMETLNFSSIIRSVLLLKQMSRRHKRSWRSKSARRRSMRKSNRRNIAWPMRIVLNMRGPLLRNYRHRCKKMSRRPRKKQRGKTKSWWKRRKLPSQKQKQSNQRSQNRKRWPNPNQKLRPRRRYQRQKQHPKNQ